MGAWRLTYVSKWKWNGCWNASSNYESIPVHNKSVAWVMQS